MKIVRRLCILLVVAALALSAAVWGMLQTYQVLRRRDVVATIECWPSTRAGEFRLVYRPFVQGRPGPAQVYQLYGDQWSMGGDLLIWRAPALLTGARTWYKVTRVEGRYATAARARSHPHAAYDVGGGSDWLWRLLYRCQGWIPGVEAVYGGSVYMPPDPTKQFILYATPSGFLVKPRQRKLN